MHTQRHIKRTGRPHRRPTVLPRFNAELDRMRGGATEQAFARSLGTSATNVYRWRAGMHKPSADILARFPELAAAYGADRAHEVQP